MIDRAGKFTFQLATNDNMVMYSALTCFISYICYLNLQFLNNVIIVKANIPPKGWVTIPDFSCPV